MLTTPTFSIMNESFWASKQQVPTVYVGILNKYTKGYNQRVLLLIDICVSALSALFGFETRVSTPVYNIVRWLLETYDSEHNCLS